jgi:hypothetical protein
MLIIMVPVVMATTWAWPARISVIARRIDILVPVILHKIYLSAACAIAATIATPLFHVSRRHAQIQGRLNYGDWWRLNNDWLGINDLRSRVGISQNDLSIKARLANRHCDACTGSH